VEFQLYEISQTGKSECLLTRTVGSGQWTLLLGMGSRFQVITSLKERVMKTWLGVGISRRGRIWGEGVGV
jgi:hypothetical protein